MNKVIKIVALVILIGVLVFGGYKLFIQKEAKDETEIIKAEKKKEGEKEVKEAPLPVTVIKAEKGNLPLRLKITASAEVWEKATIKAEVSGKIEKISYDIGDVVPKGRQLIKIEDIEKRLEVKRAKAEKLRTLSEYLVEEGTSTSFSSEKMTAEERAVYDKITSSYKKAVKDFDMGRISEAKFESIKDSYEETMVISGDLREEVLKAIKNLSQNTIALKQAELNLKRTSILNPFPSSVIDLMVSKGEIVNIGHELMKIVNLKSLYLIGYALENEIRHLKKGIKVRIKFDAYSDVYKYGEIQMISPEVDAERKIIKVFVKYDNSDNKVFPGMNAELDIEYKTMENVLKVPREAVILRNERPLVFVVTDLKGSTGTAIWKYVEIGEKNDEEWEIKSGITPGDLVVHPCPLILSHQSRVKVSNLSDVR